MAEAKQGGAPLPRTALFALFRFASARVARIATISCGSRKAAQEIGRDQFLPVSRRVA
jgi:hypothetical protein